jgi:hypothetical protein
LAGVVALLAACHDSTGPVALDRSGTYVAASFNCRTSWDTSEEILPFGASLTLVLKPDSTLGGRLIIPVDRMPGGMRAENDTLVGHWIATAEGFHVDGPWDTLLFNVDFAVGADPAQATILVQNFPLGLFGYTIRLQRQ